MSKDLNQAFVENPLQFASQKPVVPPGGQADQKNIKMFHDMPTSFRGVPGSQRIIAADLVDKGSYAEVALSYDNIDTKLDAGWMAIYFLPWLANHVISTTLRPRSETDREGTLKTGNRAVQKLSGHNGYQSDPNNPDIFFTAAVDGCMVIVDGSPSQPTVYHANRRDLETDTSVGAPDDERVPQMIEDMSSLKDLRNKQTRGKAMEPAPGAGATAAMYMPLARKTELQQNPLTVTDDERRQFAKALGAIFGVRRDDVWRFYYERLVRSNSQLWKNRSFLCIPLKGQWGLPIPSSILIRM